MTTVTGHHIVYAATQVNLICISVLRLTSPSRPATAWELSKNGSNLMAASIYGGFFGPL